MAASVMNILMAGEGVMEVDLSRGKVMYDFIGVLIFCK